MADESAPDQDPKTEELAPRLAATRAALDPERRAVRNDVLVSFVIETIGLHGPLTEVELAAIVPRQWGLSTLSLAPLKDAIRTASVAGLLVQRTQFDGEDTWDITDAVRAEVAQDRLWADGVLVQFASDFDDRLLEFAEHDIRSDRFPKLRSVLLRALVAGAASLSEVGRSLNDLHQIRPVHFDIEAMTRVIRDEVQPRPTASAVIRVAEAAIDPTDPFANDLIHLLVTGSLLHAIAEGRDIVGVPTVRGWRVLLDTTVLVYMASQGTAADKTFIELVTQCREAGVQLCVASHTIDEWDRLWQAAYDDVTGRPRKQLVELGHSHQLVENPIVRAYILEKKSKPRLSFERFSLGKRKIRDELKRHGVRVVDPEGIDMDATVYDNVLQRLAALSARSSVHQKSPRAAKADAMSCAIVRAWRVEASSTPPSAWFVGDDTQTAVAYRAACRDDPFPLTMSAEMLLVLLWTLRPPDTALAGSIGVLAEAVAERSFISVATGYSIDDALKIHRVLKEHSPRLDPADVRAAIQLDFGTFREETPAESTAPASEAVEDRALDLVHRRSSRRDERARRESERAHAAEAASRDAIRRAEEKASAKEEEAESLKGALAQATARDIQNRRRIHRAYVILGAFFAAVIMLVADWISLTPFIFSLVGVVWLWFTFDEYIGNLDKRLGSFVSHIVAAVVWELAWLIGGSLS